MSGRQEFPMSIPKLFSEVLESSASCLKKCKKIVGVLSCFFGLQCFVLSGSFESLFGELNPTKSALSATLSLAISSSVCSAENWPVSRFWTLKRKPHIDIVFLVLQALYAFITEQSMTGKPDPLSVVSSGAFALTSLCVSLQIKLGFQVGLFNFFLGWLTVQSMKIDFIFFLVAAGYAYVLILLRFYSDPPSENEGTSGEDDSDQPPEDPGPSSILIENPIDRARSATESQNEGTSGQDDSDPPSDGGGPSHQEDIDKLIDEANNARSYGKAQNVEGTGNEEEYGSMHENPKNLSKDELMAYYESAMTTMRRNHELQAQELTGNRGGTLRRRKARLGGHAAGPKSATETQSEGISEQPSSSSGAHGSSEPEPQIDLPRRSYGKAQNVEGTGNEEEYGGMHENLKNLSKDELMAYYESAITKMRRNHEFQVQELTEEIFRIRREASTKTELLLYPKKEDNELLQ